MSKYNFQIEKHQVARLEFDVLLEVFNLDHISDRSLKDYFGNVVITFGGYTPQDVHPILNPELRRFLRRLGQQWHPAVASFLCPFDSPFLWLYFVAQLDNVIVVEVPNRNRIIVYHRPDQLSLLQQQTFCGLEQLGRRAGFAQSKIVEHNQILTKLFSGLFCHMLPQQ